MSKSQYISFCHSLNFNNHGKPAKPLSYRRQYCVPHAVDLIIKKVGSPSTYKSIVRDINGNAVFKIDSPFVTIVTPREHRFLRDAYGNPIVHLRRAVFGPSNYSAPSSPSSLFSVLTIEFLFLFLCFSFIVDLF